MIILLLYKRDSSELKTYMISGLIMKEVISNDAPLLSDKSVWLLGLMDGYGLVIWLSYGINTRKLHLFSPTKIDN